MRNATRVNGSYFGHAEIGHEGMRKLVTPEIYKAYQDAHQAIRHLYEDGADLKDILDGVAPAKGIPTDEIPAVQKFYGAIEDVKNAAQERGVFLSIGYMDTKDTLEPVWTIDTEEQGEIFALSLTEKGKSIAKMLGESALGFNTRVHVMPQ